MVEPHLPAPAVKLLRASKWRQLALFFAGGALLFSLKQVSREVAEPPLLVVSVPRVATASDEQRAIDEAVLVDQALARGGALIDPVVREQLLRSMHVLSGAEKGTADTDSALLERAIAMGVPRIDPLIRQRLVFQAQQLMRAQAQVPTPADEVLDRYRLEHADRYREPERVSFVQVFLSRSRRGTALADAARELGARLAAEHPEPSQASSLSDPTILPRSEERASLKDISARFGDAFAAGLASAQVGDWHGPVESSYGLHFVRVSAREPARLPSIDELRRRLLDDYVHDMKDAAVAQRVHALRAKYRIEVQRPRG